MLIVLLAGVAFEALARVVALASPEIDQSRVKFEFYANLFCRFSIPLQWPLFFNSY